MKVLGGWGGGARTSLDPPQEPHYRDEVEGPSPVQDSSAALRTGRPITGPPFEALLHES